MALNRLAAGLTLFLSVEGIGCTNQTRPAESAKPEQAIATVTKANSTPVIAPSIRPLKLEEEIEGIKLQMDELRIDRSLAIGSIKKDLLMPPFKKPMERQVALIYKVGEIGEQCRKESVQPTADALLKKVTENTETKAKCDGISVPSSHQACIDKRMVTMLTPAEVSTYYQLRLKEAQTDAACVEKEALRINPKTVLTDETFDRFIYSPNEIGTAFVEFGSIWCGPCQEVRPELNALARSGRIKVGTIETVGQNPRAKETIGERMPVFRVYQNGKIVWEQTGLSDKSITATLEEKGFLTPVLAGAKAATPKQKQPATSTAVDTKKPRNTMADAQQWLNEHPTSGQRGTVLAAIAEINTLSGLLRRADEKLNKPDVDKEGIKREVGAIRAAIQTQKAIIQRIIQQ